MTANRQPSNPSGRLGDQEQLPHQPVLMEAILWGMAPASGKIFLDATLGYAGHARHLAPLLGPQGLYCGLDRDPEALEHSRMLLQAQPTPFRTAQSCFDRLAECVQLWGLPRLDGVLFDLGVSSPQIDRAERGFSFQQDGPLDMRMDPSQKTTAADLVNRLDEKELAMLFRQFGEERRSRSIARAIARARKHAPLRTTLQLSDLIRKTLRSRSPSPLSKKIHPATRTFQALRIAVNRELEQLAPALQQAIACLSPEGRLAVISYHSLEDRIVKRQLKRGSGACVCPPGLPRCSCGARKVLEILTAHPIRPDAEEIRQNPRARSARLRIARKLADEPAVQSRSHQGDGEGR